MVAVALVPFSALAKVGSKTFVGRGTVEGHGEGSVTFVGNHGVNCIMGRGTLTISKHAWVNIEEGHFDRTESRGMIIYTGAGEMAFGGSNVRGDFVGTLQDFKFTGRGKLTIAGTGEYNAFGKAYKGDLITLPSRMK